MKIKECYRYICDKFNKSEIISAEEEARFLICEILNLSITDLYIKANDEIDNKDVEKLDICCERRLSGEPLQYIIGKWDFMGRTYKVGPGVLIPRPETELLCENVIEVLKNKKEAIVYDLCSGSGCIGIT
ncbi:MAG: peptide chain release factor N(5)-glutamine methyltransferase, partial [Clostridia bacterium]|nr:peptide chain release factor N(5)-glutamine methyltransferase [Clostridia bacterium]